MKKFMVAVVLVLSFAVVAGAEVITFPSAKVTIDVADGWEYSDNGEGTALVLAPDKSASFSISRVSAGGMTLEAYTAELSKTHSGTAPFKQGEAMAYTFVANGVDCAVAVQFDKTGLANILVIAGNHADTDAMIDSMNIVE